LIIFQKIHNNKDVCLEHSTSFLNEHQDMSLNSTPKRRFKKEEEKGREK
jgi:hypothetical protein